MICGLCWHNQPANQRDSRLDDDNGQAHLRANLGVKSPTVVPRTNLFCNWAILLLIPLCLLALVLTRGVEVPVNGPNAGPRSLPAPFTSRTYLLADMRTLASAVCYILDYVPQSPVPTTLPGPRCDRTHVRAATRQRTERAHEKGASNLDPCLSHEISIYAMRKG